MDRFNIIFHGSSSLVTIHEINLNYSDASDA